MNNSILKIVGVCVVFILIIGAFFIKRGPMEKYRESTQMHAKMISVDVCLERGANTRKIARTLDDAWQRLRDIDHRMSTDIKDGDLEKINRSYAMPQKIGADTIEVFQSAIKYKKLTHGAFDVTAQSLRNLWNKCQKEGRLPTASELKIAKDAIGLEHVKFVGDNKVQIANKNITVDYTGIVTGYMLDEAVRIIRKRGYKNFLIDADGDMFASGLNCERKPWKFAIKNPDNKTTIMDVVEVSNASVSTAGDYQHFYFIGGQKFANNINPLTGYPRKGVVTSTVIAPTAIDGGALAASLCILDPAQGVALIDSLGKDYAGIVISKDQSGRFILVKNKTYQDFQVRKRSR